MGMDLYNLSDLSKWEMCFRRVVRNPPLTQRDVGTRIYVYKDLGGYNNDYRIIEGTIEAVDGDTISVRTFYDLLGIVKLSKLKEHRAVWLLGYKEDI